jgi:hypothetical protein
MAERPRGRPESTGFCRFSRARDGREALAQISVAASHNTGVTTTTLCAWVSPRQHEQAPLWAGICRGYRH